MEKLVQTNIVAGVVIKENDKYLLVQENRPGTKVHGLWNFPAGKVEEGDSIEKTAIKEAKEEVGYDVDLVKKLGIFQTHTQTPPKHAFEAKIIGGKLDWPKDEILDVQWFSWKEIQNMQDKLREEWIIGAIQILEDLHKQNGHDKQNFKHIKSEEIKQNDFGSVKVQDLLNNEEYEKFSIAKVEIIEDQKFGLDQESDTSYYVLDGQGKFFIEDKETNVKKGDLIFIPKNTKYKDVGNLTLLAISSPRFDRNKRIRFDE